MTNKDAEFTGLLRPRMRKKKPVDQSVIDLARERVREAYKLFDTIIVSFSAGKDSTAVLNITLEAARELKRLPLRAQFFDEEAIPYETEAYVRRVAESGEIALDWYSLPVKHRNACSRTHPFWYPWAPEDETKWVRCMPPESITFDRIEGWPRQIEQRYSIPESIGLLFDPLKVGRVGVLMGIRADESMTRLRATVAPGPEPRNYIRELTEVTSRGNLWKVYPIYDWGPTDVWTAPATLGWDYNRSYDLMELAGISHRDQRCAPPYGEEPLANLHMFAKCFPDIWDKMAYRVPGSAMAARYSKTALYSFGKKIAKSDDMGWQEYIRHWLDRHPPQYRAIIAGKVKMMIKKHYERTGEPILPRAKHPITGMSWEFLANIASRGDYKGRRTATYGDVGAMRTRYDKERAEYEASSGSGRMDQAREAARKRIQPEPRRAS